MDSTNRLGNHCRIRYNFNHCNTGRAGQNGNITVTAGNPCGTSAASSLAVTVNPGNSGNSRFHNRYSTSMSGINRSDIYNSRCIKCYDLHMDSTCRLVYNSGSRHNIDYSNHRYCRAKWKYYGKSR